MAIIVAAGNLESEEDFYTSLLQKRAFLIAVDGGLKLFRKQNIKPDILLGDMDSISQEDMNWACQAQIPQKKFSCDKDKTDTHLALDMAIENKNNPIYILGGIGCRLDHTLANLYLLVYGYEKGAEVRILHPSHYVTLLTPSCKKIVEKKYGAILSILPVSPILSGLTMAGFRWNLQDKSIAQGMTWTVSNFLEEETGTIFLQDGMAFVIQEKL